MRKTSPRFFYPGEIFEAENPVVRGVIPIKLTKGYRVIP
jgi:hypothetical protein